MMLSAMLMRNAFDMSHAFDHLLIMAVAKMNRLHVSEVV